MGLGECCFSQDGASCMLCSVLQALLNNSHLYHMAREDFANRGIEGRLAGWHVPSHDTLCITVIQRDGNYTTTQYCTSWLWGGIFCEQAALSEVLGCMLKPLPLSFLPPPSSWRGEAEPGSHDEAEREGC